MNRNRDHELNRVTEQVHPCYLMEVEFMDGTEISWQGKGDWTMLYKQQTEGSGEVHG